jgi:hypothetical protein
MHFTKGGSGGISGCICVEEFFEVAEVRKQLLIGMCVLIRAELKFVGCAPGA